MADAGEVTRALQRIGAGDADAFETLLELVYPELCELAHRYMRRERPDHTLQATAVVNEAYLRLLGGTNLSFTDRGHFFAVAARAMRRVLTDHARRRGRKKRGGGWARSSLDDLQSPESWSLEDILALDEALHQFAEVDPRKSRMIEMRYFTGLSTDEIAQFFEVHVRSVERDLRFSQVWLLREMTQDALGEEGH